MGIRDRYLLRRSEEFYLVPGQEASVNLALKEAPPPPCTRLYGQVICGCSAVAGATVKIFSPRFRPLHHTDTDKDGYFSFVDVLPPGAYVVLAAADGYVVSESRFLSLIPLIPRHIVIRLWPDPDASLGTVFGTVRDEKNMPLPGAQIKLFPCDGPERPEAVTVSSADGEYLVHALREGSYVVKASCKGYQDAQSAPFALCPKEIRAIDLFLSKDASQSEGTISGMVSRHGAAVPYALTALYRLEDSSFTLVQTLRANARGQYLFSGLPIGTYVVKAKLGKEDAVVSMECISE